MYPEKIASDYPYVCGTVTRNNKIIFHTFWSRTGENPLVMDLQWVINSLEKYVEAEQLNYNDGVGECTLNAKAKTQMDMAILDLSDFKKFDSSGVSS